MARETVKKVIDGEDYEFSQYGAKASLKLLIKLSKILGKPLALAMTSAEGSGPLGERFVNPLTLSGAVEALVERLEEGEVLEIIENLTARDCLCKGARIEFNTHYEGRLPHLFKVLVSALEVQYGNFFGALQELQGAIRPASTPAPLT